MASAMTVTEAIAAGDEIVGSEVELFGLLLCDKVERVCRLGEIAEKTDGPPPVIQCLLIQHDGLYDLLDQPRYWGKIRLVPGIGRFPLQSRAVLCGTLTHSQDERFPMSIIALKSLRLTSRRRPDYFLDVEL